MAHTDHRARRFLNYDRKERFSSNGSETIGFNKSKVECYNCHKRGHFVREYRAPKENRIREPVRRNVTVKTTETQALVLQVLLSSDLDGPPQTKWTVAERNIGTLIEADCWFNGYPDAGFKPSGEEETIDAEHPENENSEFTVNTASLEDNAAHENIVYGCDDNLNMPNLEEIAYSDDDEEVGAEDDMNNLAITMPVSPIPTTIVYKDHPLEQIIEDIHSAPQTKRMTKNVTEHGNIAQKGNQVVQIHAGIVSYAIRASAEFKLQKIEEVLWLEQARLVDQDTLKKGIDYDEVFAPVARIEAIRLFLAYASFKDFVVVLKIQRFPDKVYKVEKALYGLHQDPRACSNKYVDEILKMFGFSTVKTASTPTETLKPLLKDTEAEDVDVYLYRLMIRSLMYLTSSRPDIMFVVYGCARFQVTPKVSHLHAEKRIFRYLKVQPKMGLWYPKDSPFNLEAYIDSDYASASLDRKSTTGGCQFPGSKLISWQCKKQTIVANYTTESKYVVVASCCGQVLWIQNQMLDYGYNFMYTKIFIDNESTICIVKNLVFHSKTKHIEIRHHFIRDSNKKKLIQMIKIHTDQNVADLLTKAFDVGRFQYLIATADDAIQVSTVGQTYYYALMIQALVDKKKVIVTEKSVRSDLMLEDAEGTECLPNDVIFEQLTLMGAKTTAWNEFCWIILLNRSKPSACKEFAPLDTSKATILKH
ncbi:putative reverse transcriptase, RNA-dependent DNA polymerase [Tanacetum coccineum]